MKDISSTSRIYSQFAAGLNQLSRARDPEIISLATDEDSFAHVYAKPVSEQVLLPGKEYAAQKRSALGAIAKAVGKDGIWIGVAGFANLDIMAKLESPAGALVDINPNQDVMWERLFDVVKRSPERHEAASLLRSLPLMVLSPTQVPDQQAQAVGARHLETTDIGIAGLKPLNQTSQWENYLKEYTEDPSSWLGSDKNYNHIRTMISHEALGHATLDIQSPRDMRRLKDYVESKAAELNQPIKVAGIYLSNIVDFVTSSTNDFYGRKAIKDNLFAGLQVLCDPETLLIDSRRTSAGYMPTPCTLTELTQTYGVKADIGRPAR